MTPFQHIVSVSLASAEQLVSHRLLGTERNVTRYFAFVLTVHKPLYLHDLCGGGGRLVRLIALRPLKHHFLYSRTLSKHTSFRPTTTYFFDQPPWHPARTVVICRGCILRSRPAACLYLSAMPACTAHLNADRSTAQVDVFHKATGHAPRFPNLLTSRFFPQPPVRHRFPISTPISYSTKRLSTPQENNTHALPFNVTMWDLGKVCLQRYLASRCGIRDLFAEVNGWTVPRGFQYQGAL